MLSEAQRQALAVQFRAQQLPTSSAIGRRPSELTELPPSFAQEQLWFIDRLAPGLPTYNVPARLRLRGALDVPALRTALAGVLARHEALRTRFVVGARGTPVQVIDAPGELVLPVIDLVGADPAAERELSASAAAEPFDLAAGPLLRCRLLRLAEDEHVLLIVVHHIVFDAWSFDVLLRELANLYAAAVTDRPAELAELPVQYADYALWERQRLAESESELVDFWRATLEGHENLELPTDHPRPMLESFRGGIRRHQLGAEAAEAVEALGKQRTTTPFVVLLAALQGLLARYTGQRDIVVGVPSANRGRSSLQPLIGFLVNTLPIRADLSGDPTFLQLLDRLRTATVAAYAHSELPLARLVEAIGVERDPSRTPLFNVLLTSARAPAEVTAAGLRMQLERIDLPAAKFDLAFFAEFCPDGLWLEVTYASDLFDVETIDRMLVHYGELLTGALADPSLRLSELPLLSEAELFAELVEWNATATTAPDPDAACPGVHRLFDEQARRTPEAVAAVFGEDEVSYAELSSMAHQLAGWLVEEGMRSETLVGVAMAPSIQRLAVLLGILAAGGGYLPLDPSLPPDRLSFLAGDAALELVIADPVAGIEPILTAAGVRSLDPGWVERSAADPGAPAVPVTGSNIAYVLYTSGSTGQPKGVVVEHAQLVNFALGAIATWQLTPADRMLQYASLNFDVSVLDVFGCLLAGATAVIADADTRLSPPRLGELMRRQRVSFAFLSPALLGLLADQSFPDLRLLASGGEALPTEVAKAWLRDGLRLVNGYGPTEATVVSVSEEVDGRTWPAPIGRPMPNYQAYVLDQDLNPVPVGVIGELHIGGASVARGYLNRPELTAERFLDDPFSLEPNARLYRTGDLVKRLPDGRISYLGRADGQVKIRGLRIELGEIEAALARHPAVEQAVVQLEQDQAGAKFLAGYLRRAPAAEEPDAPAITEDPEPAAVTDFLRQWLPEYMIPQRLGWLDSFPLNASGKVDRRRLSASLASTGGQSSSAPPTAPTTRTEALLLDIYADLLGRDRRGVLESFFDAGGNSLQAMQLVSRISAEFGVDLPVTAVFLAPDVRRLAARIEQTDGAPAAGSRVLVRLSEGTASDPLFLVHAVGGTVLPYAPVAEELADRYRVFGIQSPMLVTESEHATPEHATPEPDTLAELAGRYLAELREVQPSGPYRIGGWSMGGLLAHQLACQLEQAGEAVQLLVLLDAPFSIAETAGTDEQLTSQFVADALRTLGAPVPDPAEYEEGADPLATLMSALDPRASDRGALAAEVRRRLAVFSRHRRLMSGYRPAGRVRAATLLINARHSPNAATHRDWAGLVEGELRTASYDADHYTLLQPPHVRDIAERLRDFAPGTA